MEANASSWFNTTESLGAKMKERRASSQTTEGFRCNEQAICLNGGRDDEAAVGGLHQRRSFFHAIIAMRTRFKLRGPTLFESPSIQLLRLPGKSRASTLDSAGNTW